MMSDKKKALKMAVPRTIPVMAGYIFLGIAFGILLNAKSYGVLWALAMSLFIYAGSMQYVAITLLTAAFHPMAAFLMTLMVNARHLFYGLSMLDKFKNTGILKPYLIFGLTDETFSVLCTVEEDSKEERKWLMFWITLLDQCYWVLGSVIGSLLGTVISFNTKGLDFVLTALFVVILTSQWQESKEHRPALIGLAVTALCRIFFGTSSFLIPAMIGIIIGLSILKKSLQRGDIQ